jgi:hypothetical protein
MSLTGGHKEGISSIKWHTELNYIISGSQLNLLK